MRKTITAIIISIDDNTDKDDNGRKDKEDTPHEVKDKTRNNKKNGRFSLTLRNIEETLSTFSRPDNYNVEK